MPEKNDKHAFILGEISADIRALREEFRNEMKDMKAGMATQTTATDNLAKRVSVVEQDIVRLSTKMNLIAWSTAAIVGSLITYLVNKLP